MTPLYNGWGLMPKASLSRMDPFGAGPAAPRPAGREHRVSQRSQRILTLCVLPARTTVQRSNAFGRAGVPSLLAPACPDLSRFQSGCFESGCFLRGVLCGTVFAEA